MVKNEPVKECLAGDDSPIHPFAPPAAGQWRTEISAGTLFPPKTALHHAGGGLFIMNAPETGYFRICISFATEEFPVRRR